MSAAIVAAIRASRKRQQQCMLDEAEEQEEEPEAHANAQGDLCYNLLFTRVCAINDNLIGTAELLSLLQLIEPRRIRTMNTHHKLATDILTLARAHRSSSPPLAHRQPVRLTKEEFCQFLHTLLQSRKQWPENFLTLRYSILTLFNKMHNRLEDGINRPGIHSDFLPFVSCPCPFGHDDAASCSICKEEYQRESVESKHEVDARHRLPCSHSFHGLCIDEWLEQNVNCPLCRSNVLTTAALDAKKKNSGGIFSIRKSDSSATSSSCIVQ